ncbi:peritrophin-48-like [Homarus americanus]|uniref:peritrophin-48-like n=1 Tax=Homarus americanus TaxID=6706 RepID=UPI001C490543|nr:peritrophin-48-like [Homarus americanus]
MVDQDNCSPVCLHKNPLDKVPDPMNCTNYYICLGDDMPADHSVPCESGNIFDNKTNECISGTDCDPICKPLFCPITCNGTYSLISDPFRCDQYYICIPGGVQGPITCQPDRPYFDGKACVKSKEVCCEVPCIHIVTREIYRSLPTDCHMYYICTAEGPVDPNLHFTCPSGDVFDYQVGRCVKGDKCTTLCPAFPRLA